MKKIIISVCSIIGIFIILFISYQERTTGNAKKILYTLNRRQYTLLTATNPQEWQQGLMGYRKLDGADGMIFVFPDKQIRSFWNKNTFMDLDLYWLNDDKVIGKSYLPSIEKSKGIVIIASPDKTNKVVELLIKK